MRLNASTIGRVSLIGGAVLTFVVMPLLGQDHAVLGTVAFVVGIIAQVAGLVMSWAGQKANAKYELAGRTKRQLRRAVRKGSSSTHVHVGNGELHALESAAQLLYTAGINVVIQNHYATDCLACHKACGALIVQQPARGDSASPPRHDTSKADYVTQTRANMARALVS